VPPTKAVIAAAGLSLLAIDVGDRGQWRDPNHPLRMDSQLKLTGIPTLIEWTENGPAAKRLGKQKFLYFLITKGGGGCLHSLL
jgi:Eukaryotic protein of unknown function (DUF953)